MFRPTDLGVIAVASNNLAVLNRDQNLFDSRKRIKTATAPETEPKLNSFQKKIVQVNEALLAIYTGQVTGTLQIEENMKSSFLVRCSETNSGQDSSEGRRYGRDDSIGQGFLVDEREEVH